MARVRKDVYKRQDYKQWKTSIIYEAVTKGLDPDAEMKDSGIEWIGKMPLHWKVSRIKNETINEDNLREPISAENRNNQLGLYDYYGASGAIDKIDDSNFAHRFCLCTLKIQYLAGIRLSKFHFLPYAA